MVSRQAKLRSQAAAAADLVDFGKVDLHEAQGSGGIAFVQQLAQLLQHMAYAGVLGQAQLVLRYFLSLVTMKGNLQQQ